MSSGPRRSLESARTPASAAIRDRRERGAVAIPMSTQKIAEEQARSGSGFGTRSIRDPRSRSVEEWITDSLVEQLHGQYGWKESVARDYAADFLTGQAASRVVDKLLSLFPVRGATVLELGSGLGSILLEMRRRGIRAAGIEPSEEWCGIIRRRFEKEGLPPSCLVQGIGERLPFADASVDLVVSLQVLEHVQEPERVLAEIDRVLRPGGTLYLSAPNYFSFSEDHYRVLWFPGLTHRTGSWYLRLRGRDPEFYRHHVNNLTFFQVQRAAKALGWINLKWERRVEKVRNERSLGARISRAWLRLAPGLSRRLYLASKSLKTDMNLHFRKPGSVDPEPGSH